jgi:ATP-dependent exoDNAse (exonuclease V) beta subunit
MNLTKPTIDWYQKLNQFKNDEFKFFEAEHEYKYKGKKFESVTTFISQFHEKFDSDYWSQIKAEERGITQQEILAEWKAKADRSCDLGTMVHEYAEYKCAGKEPKEVTDEEVKKRIISLEEIFETKLKKFIPVAQEIKVFSPKLKLAGTIDGLFEYKQKLVVGDYKTNEKFTTDSDKCYKKLNPPFQNRWENKLNEYSIQVSMYRLILEEWGIETEAAFLIHIPPVGKSNFHIAHDFRNELKIFFGI